MLSLVTVEAPAVTVTSGAGYTVTVTVSVVPPWQVSWLSVVSVYWTGDTVMVTVPVVVLVRVCRSVVVFLAVERAV